MAGCTCNFGRNGPTKLEKGSYHRPFCPMYEAPPYKPPKWAFLSNGGDAYYVYYYGVYEGLYFNYRPLKDIAADLNAPILKLVVGENWQRDLLLESLLTEPMTTPDHETKE